jgi:hypothetical protein
MRYQEIETLFEAEALPMDAKSRMQRAKEMGFTIRAYHGTGAQFKAFDLEKGTPHNGMGHAPYFSTVKAEAKGYADERKEAGLKTRLLEVLLRVKNPLQTNYWDSPISEADYEKIAGRPWKESDGKCNGFNAMYTLKNTVGAQYGWSDKRAIWTQIYRHLISLGYDALIDHNTPGDHHTGGYGKVVVFNPKNIRSIKARFDPAKSESSNLLD